jgi:hypothetical protein
MQVNVRRAAWMQGVTVAVLALVLGGTLIDSLRRPFDRDTLAIQVETLQSHAAEAARLAVLMRDDRIAPGFTAEHASQLAENVQRAQDALAGKEAEPAFATQRATAMQLGAVLHAQLQAWSSDGALARTRDFGFDPLAHQLDALHRQLKPQG